METRITGHIGYTLIKVTGRIDSESYTAFGLALSQVTDSGERFLALDLSDVTYINSVGLRELVSSAKLVREVDGDIVLIAPSKRVMEVLEITGIGSIFIIAADETEAERHYNARDSQHHSQG